MLPTLLACNNSLIFVLRASSSGVRFEESFQAYMADLTDMQEHVLPYLQSFCSLEEKAPERVEGAVQYSTLQ